jgi:hypothetical protein
MHKRSNNVKNVTNVTFGPHDQGDQIGRVFAYWALVYFGQFSENYTITLPNILG